MHKVCAGLADQNQIADVLQEMFHGDKKRRHKVNYENVLGVLI